MNTANIKSYAPKARRDFIQAVTEKAHLLGLSKNQVEPVEIKGDVAIIAGRPYPKEVGTIRQGLENRIRQDGFELTMRKMAYTWFNRFVAIRYMELHDYLDHGYRVLSNRTGSEIPEILEHATDVELPGLNKEEVVRLRLAGDKDNELYQLLIVAQCNALSRAMPFLFERIGGYDELLMPDNLLHSNSPIRNLVNEIPEEDWQQIEIIGWIYQFYITEKKDEVIGKVVKSEDIPAATQLFTPNWIVKYMVQNSLGAQWLETYPHSPLRGQMEYYIEPAEQTDEVKAQLAAITPNSLNPEELTLMDPACGSGHILVEAYELFKVIYLERGYRQRDVAQLILEKNLFGLDIDGRAAQLTGFALMMKGRADDRRLFERGVKLNVMALVDSTGFDPEEFGKNVALADYGLHLDDLTELNGLFEHATTFGSLIQVPEGITKKLQALKQMNKAASQKLFLSGAPKHLGPLLRQAELLAAQYDAVVANPPYMGSKFYCAPLKKYTAQCFPGAKSDLFACFIERGCSLTKEAGHNAMVTMQSWMFLSSFERMRVQLLLEKTICTMAHMGNGVMGIAFGTAATILRNVALPAYVADYSYTSAFDLNSKRVPSQFPIRNARLGRIAQDEFQRIPGSPIAYWVGAAARCTFAGRLLGEIAKPLKGFDTGGNTAEYFRFWSEVAETSIYREGCDLADCTWVEANKGGSFRKWYGNRENVVLFKNLGASLYNKKTANIRNKESYFKPGITYSIISSAGISFRRAFPEAIIEQNGPTSVIEDNGVLFGLLAIVNSKVADYLLRIVSSTMAYTVNDVAKLPIIWPDQEGKFVTASLSITGFARSDWDAYERSWDFQTLPILNVTSKPTLSLELSYTTWITQNSETIAEMKRLEEENNRLLIDAYSLADELQPDVPVEQLTLTTNPAYRYGGNLTEEELWTRFRQDTMQELTSYAIGCMMGRYSLNEPGLIYAHSGNEGFDPSRYTTFSADDDGILPLTDTEWFADDTAHRLIEFISVAWDAAHLEDNLTFLADNLSPKKNESSRDTIRRYLCDSFFRDHLQTYKKRPIYWLLSSGKQKAFQCLVYLHRYNESTLSRVRSAYVTPLFGYFNARLEYLQNEWDAADSASTKKKFQKEIDYMKKKLAELSTFDDELRHYADKRISLDLDDGVKVNYSKFGNLLAEKKTITGE